MFDIPGRIQKNSTIGVTPDGASVYLSDGRAIYLVHKDGVSTKVASLETVEVLGGEKLPQSATINWYFARSPSTGHFYFVLLGGGPGNFVGQLNPTTNELRLLQMDFPAGIDIDLDSGLVYACRNQPAPSGRHSVVVRSYRRVRSTPR